MFLKEFYSSKDQHVLIGADQASRFAKEIAGDFNPLHDADAKRFCVPGDLLFSLVLEKYGLSSTMTFTFSGMVGHDVLLNFPETEEKTFALCDDSGRVYLKVERSGESSRDESVIENFIRNYVAFSGPNFPHVLVPLMASHNVMINTERPLVIYDSMSFELDRLDFNAPSLEAAETCLEVNGKRGDARLHFKVKAAGETVGSGFKKLVISGIREYDKALIDAFVKEYLERMESYLAGV